MTVYPAVLTESVVELTEQLALINQNPDIETAHIDVIDGFFADALTVTPSDLAEVELDDLKLDLHLITTEPLDFVYEAISAMTPSSIRAIIGQVEQMSWQPDFIAEIKKHGWKAGLALNLYTPVEEIAEESWAELDVILLLAVEAGTQGDVFNPVVIEKLAEVQKILKKHDRQVEIIIDGGIKKMHLAELSQAGADSVAIGSAIWTSSDPEHQLSELLKAV